MKKHLANILSTSRIAIALILFWFSDITMEFIMLYSMAGLSDLLDGPVARLTDSVSRLGSRLDTCGDVLTYFAVTKIFILKDLIMFKYLVIIGTSLLLIVLSTFIGFMRFGSVFFVHTICGKILGFSCFLLPFASYSSSLNYLLPVICILLVILAFESLIIQLKTSTPNPDIKSIFSIL